MSLEQAVKLMRTLGCSEDTLELTYSTSDWPRCHVYELFKHYGRGAFARKVDCNFYGGPPGKQKMYAGTILTLLIDRVCATVIDPSKQEKLPELLACNDPCATIKI